MLKLHEEAVKRNLKLTSVARTELPLFAAGGAHRRPAVLRRVDATARRSTGSTRLAILPPLDRVPRLRVGTPSPWAQTDARAGTVATAQYQLG